jgi:hypothetical protein
METDSLRHAAELLRWFIEAEKEECPWLLDERWSQSPLAIKVKEAEALLKIIE